MTAPLLTAETLFAGRTGTVRPGATAPNQDSEVMFLDAPVLTPAPNRVLHLVSTQPGKTIRELAKALGSSHATVTYHLALLVRLGLLVRQRDGRDVRHYVRNADPRVAFVAAVSQDARAGRVIDYLAAHPDCVSLNQLAVACGASFGLAKRTLQRLQPLGMVDLQRLGFRYRIKVGPEFARLHRAAQGARSGVAN